jgi:hypothetical protein
MELVRDSSAFWTTHENWKVTSKHHKTVCWMDVKPRRTRGFNIHLQWGCALRGLILYYFEITLSCNRSNNSNNNHNIFVCLFVCVWRDSPQWARASSFTRFLDHKQRRTTVDRTPLHEWSARRRDLSLPDNTQHSQQTKSMSPVGFEPTTPTGERPQTYALDRAATETGNNHNIRVQITITRCRGARG